MAMFETPLTERYNNPGALKYAPWMGPYGATLGPNGRDAKFEDPQAGYGLMGRVLDTYKNKYGLNTVSDIINRWAPPNVDNNSTGTYTTKVAQSLGVDPNAPLSAEHRQPLMQYMANYEAGRPTIAPMGLSAGSAPGSFPAAQDEQGQRGGLPNLSQTAERPDLAGLLQGLGMQRSEPSGNIFDRLGNSLQSPLALIGLGIMSGKTVGGGAMEGVQLSQAVEKQKREDERARMMLPLQILLARAQAVNMDANSKLHSTQADVARDTMPATIANIQAQSKLHNTQADVATGAAPSDLLKRAADAKLAGLQAQTAERELNTPKTAQVTIKDGESIGYHDPRKPNEINWVQPPDGGAPKVGPDLHKAISAADANQIVVDSSIRTMEKVKSLLPLVYSGWGAGTVAAIANNTPSITNDGLLLSRKRAEATRQYDDLMSAEATKKMSEELKGATTNFEMQKYVTRISDPSQPIANRMQALNEMITDLKRHKDLSLAQAKDIRSGKYFKPGYDPSQAISPSPATYGSEPAQKVEDRKTMPNGKSAVKINGQWYEE